MSRVTPAMLCSEFDVSYRDMWQAIRELRINVTRMGAHLNASQAAQLRTYWTQVARAEEKRVQARERARVETARRPAPAREPATRPVTSFPKSCTCCERRWSFVAEEDRPLPCCPDCRTHYPQQGEDISRRLDRAEAHAVLFKRDRDNAYEAVARKHAEEERAYESRAKWRNALVEVVLDHDEVADGLCWCGDAYPCRTWRTLLEANKGIHRQVEKWSSWSEQRLEEFLYGEEHQRTSRLVIDEDEPALPAEQDPGSPNAQAPGAA